MGKPRKPTAWTSRVRFSGASSGAAHRDWYRAFADLYDAWANPVWTARTVEFLDRQFRRRGVRNVVDVACGTFAIDLRLAKRGYDVVGRDLSPEMVRVGQRAARHARVPADVAVADMRTLRLGREFDAVLCIGTAFNYLTEPGDVRRAFRTFRTLLRPGGLLVLDLTNFDAWIGDPMNARLEVERRTASGTRVAIFGFNEQTPGKTLHLARFLTLVQVGRRIDIRFDEAPLRVWSKEALSRALRTQGFRPVAWYGDFAVGAAYRRGKSPRLVALATRL